MGTVVALRGWDCNDSRASAIAPPSHVSPQLLGGVSVLWTSIGEKGMSPPMTASLGVNASLRCYCNSSERSAHYCNSKSTEAQRRKILRMAILEGVAIRSVRDLVASGPFSPLTVACEGREE